MLFQNLKFEDLTIDSICEILQKQYKLLFHDSVFLQNLKSFMKHHLEDIHFSD